MKTKILLVTISLFISATMIQCSDDDHYESKGRVNMRITDAPSDDATIQGTFITVADVKVDGKSVEGFSKQTIEISAYQNGKTKLLFDEEFEADTYGDITLVLDNEVDASGNSPGCYVLDTQNTKHYLGSSASATTEIKMEKNFMVEPGGTTDLVIDFDLRKSIVRNPETNEPNKYKLVTSAELKNSVRLVAQEKCGDIKGKVVKTSGNGELIVYAYRKGEFNTAAEYQGQGASGVLFAKAVASSKVAADGSYQLSFLEEEEYEVHVAAYEKNVTTGKLEFKAMADASSAISGILLNAVSVSAKSNINLNINVIILM
ncbi:MAG: DUF4382 domain-containing protein [Prolixibacteraceae bacterium]|jgi:hypothetical protein|nr:DUF4382 domain-containing protein [Prolixibacteraceae bacterium]